MSASTPGSFEPHPHGGSRGDSCGVSFSGADRGTGGTAFPPGFLWGAATSAYQIEGAVDTDGRGPSVWDTFCRRPGKIARGDTGDVACDSYHRLSDDLDLVESLGLNAYRFSISWARVQPFGKGPANDAGLDYYRRLVDGLQDRGIVAVATLFHWDLPQALDDEGGWPERETAHRFADYAALVAAALGDRVSQWITVNEPQVVADHGYRTGEHAPGLTDDALAAATTHHLLLGHGLALQALRATLPAGTPVGITLNLTDVRPADAGAAHAAAVLDAEVNRLYLDPVLRGRYPDVAPPATLPAPGAVKEGDLALIAAPIDFLGINYYAPMIVRLRTSGDLRAGEERLPGHPGVVTVRPEGMPATPMGWLVDPAGLANVLARVGDAAPGLALYVTENGCAADDYLAPDGDVRDHERVEYLHGHLDAIAIAIAHGVDVRGYFAWSLLDNFEWAHGYQRRFGIVFVDFPSGRRVPKSSARYYSAVARANRLPSSP